MAKLYAEITSDKGGRVVGKGSNSKLFIDIKTGNRQITRLVVQHEENVVEPMNSYQKTSGVTVKKDNSGLVISYLLDK